MFDSQQEQNRDAIEQGCADIQPLTCCKSVFTTLLHVQGSCWPIQNILWSYGHLQLPTRDVVKRHSPEASTRVACNEGATTLCPIYAI